MTQLGFDLGAHGMACVSAAVEHECPGWMDMAVDAVRRFAAHQSGLFTVEMMRAVIQDEIPPTHRLRVWGPVTQAAIRAGYIEKTRHFAPAVSSNRSPKPLFRKGRA